MQNILVGEEEWLLVVKIKNHGMGIELNLCKKNV